MAVDQNVALVSMQVLFQHISDMENEFMVWFHVFFLEAWLLEGPEYMRPKLIFQSDICIILVQFLGIQSQFLAISFLSPQTTIIRIKKNPCTYLLVVFFDSVSVYCDKLQVTNLLQGQRRQPF